MPAELEHVLILGMDYGIVLFTSDRGITPAAAAKLADDLLRPANGVASKKKPARKGSASALA